MLNDKPFYQFVREERLFCATLAHLLMQKGPNLQTFLSVVNSKLPKGPYVSTDHLDGAEIYLEFTFLRDYWSGLARDNDAKRHLIFELLSRVDGLHHYKSASFPNAIPAFNAIFMGVPGGRITNDIVSPGRWSVVALSKRFKEDPQQFRDFCRFKWAFNIKPDVVVLVPGSKPLSIEAKLESKEGHYPTSNHECQLFDEVFGEERGRVGQIELQQFMFGTLLDAPCQSVFIGRSASSEPDSVFLSWEEVFSHLDLTSSVGYVRRLIKENRHLVT